MSNDCYPRLQEVGWKGWGHTEVTTWHEYVSKGCSLVGCYHLLATGEEMSIVTHNERVTPSKYKTQAK